LEYPSIVAVSQRVAWTVDEIFADRRFDATKHIVPDSWLGTGHLAFLSDREQRTLNHIRDFSYAHLLGNYEEFIPLQMAEVAGRDWHDDRARLRGLFRFGEEEMKHQQLFQRTEDVLEASCGHEFGRYFDPEKVRLTTFVKAVLAYPLLPRFLLLAAFEWGTQRHYVSGWLSASTTPAYCRSINRPAAAPPILSGNARCARSARNPHPSCQATRLQGAL
jgi:hypothetical protein